MDEKKSMLSALIELSKVDGKVTEMETGFIHQIGMQLGVAENELLDLFEHPVEFNPPKQHFERIVQFQRMVLLMNVDLKVDEKELAHLKFMGMRLGLNPNAVNEVLTRMYDYPDNMIPPNDLIAIYAKHMN